jgi:hypothetical protein
MQPRLIFKVRLKAALQEPPAFHTQALRFLHQAPKWARRSSPVWLSSFAQAYSGCRHKFMFHGCGVRESRHDRYGTQKPGFGLHLGLSP